MNVAFLLTPKSEVVWVSASGSIGQALERMKPNGFSAVPILDDEGCYAGTLGTNDLLWYLLDRGHSWQETAATMPLSIVPRRLQDTPVHIDADLATVMARAASQSFVPVVDDREVFIGIVRRRPIIDLCARLAGPVRGSFGRSDKTKKAPDDSSEASLSCSAYAQLSGSDRR